MRALSRPAHAAHRLTKTPCAEGRNQMIYHLDFAVRLKSPRE